MAEVNANPEFFVGWMPLPEGHRRVVVPVALLLVVIVAGIAGIVAWSQRSPGTAVWEDAAPRTITGVAFVRPCAMLRTMDAESGTVRTILLVEEGKFGATGRLEAFDGQAVRIHGTLLHREGRWMMELAPGDDAIEPVENLPPEMLQRLRKPSIGEVTSVRLVGEVIDPKCYLGAMKPGGGKTHKACAALCLRGGIPPMLVVRDGGVETFWLLVDDEGRLATDLAIPFVGEPVVVTGETWREDDLRLLRIGNDGIRRR